ncbi:MAG: CotH kinase family protein [Verrucomicrobiota bacterium]
MKHVPNPFLIAPRSRASLTWSVAALCAIAAVAAAIVAQDGPPDGPPPGDFGGPPGPGGPGQGRPMFFGGPMQEETKLVKGFDKDGDGRLNAAERKAARASLQKERANGRGRRMGGPPGGPGGGLGEVENAKPGPKVSPEEVKIFSGAGLYDPMVLRTFFLEFEEADWEKELSDFHDTDVEVPAKLTVDGKVYPDVGVHFRGMSSYMAVSEGRKRSLNLSLDFAHKEQNVGGYRTLNLLNSHEDPSFLRSVLSYQIDRSYIPAPKANLARVVINGESWGIYVNVQQFNKDFVKDWFGTTKGARWKVRGSPGGQGSLAYLGEDAAAYKRIYTIKTKDEPKRWADLIRLCKVLNQTPPERLEEALAPLLDIDGALKFLALDNALINNDGYWIRTSDYALYQDEKGRFHLIPQDSNETFAQPGGPGFGGGPGGPRFFGPGMFLAPAIMSQADKDADQTLNKAEFTALADTWFDKLDSEKAGKLSQEQFNERFGELLPAQPVFQRGRGGPGGGPGAGGGGGRNFGPARFAAQGIFAAADKDKDGQLSRSELRSTLEKWFEQWDADHAGSIDGEKLRTGLAAALPPPNARFGGGPPGGGQAGPGPAGRPGFGGGGAPGGAVQTKGVELDPLVAANDASKPLISKLLAVPALRARYLQYVRDIAENWLDWQKLGPIAEQYQALITEDVKSDTRKLDSTEAFLASITQDVPGNGFGPFGRGTIGLKNFAAQRQKYLLEKTEVKAAPR